MSNKNQQILNMHLPDPLQMVKGEKVDSVEDWQQQRRPEILELFRRNVYGRNPVERPGSLRFNLLDETRDACGGLAIRRFLEITFAGPGGSGSIHLLLFIPLVTLAPAPCFLLINNRGKATIHPENFKSSPFWPVERILARGYATAAFDVADVDPDEHDEFHNGVHGIFDPPGKPRLEDAWGTIAAWAWGASRAMDYLETDPSLDPKRVAVLGHSRGGKTALWCGAQDARFALVISNESGCTGAALARGNTGESIQQINAQFPHWFCRAYHQFNNQDQLPPLDQHMLLGLIAPRHVVVASAQEDAWADPENEFLACVYAEPVFRLFGLKGPGTQVMPAIHTPLHEGNLGYHIRAGQHDLTEYDWERFMDYSGRHWST